MTFTSRAKILGVRCNQYLRRALPQDAPVKRLAGVLGQSRQTAARLFAGDPPTATQLTALASHFGKDFLAHVFEPLVGEMSDVATDVALSRVEALLLSLRPPESVSPGDAAPAGTAGAPVSRRLPLAEIVRYPSLRPALERARERAGRWELPLAIAEARADPLGRTSVTTCARGDQLRFAYRCRASRIHAPNEPVRGKPVAALADPAYARIIRELCEEAAQAGGPVLTRNAGAVRRPDGGTVPVDVIVLWAADRGRDGALVFTSSFAPAGPP